MNANARKTQNPVKITDYMAITLKTPRAQIEQYVIKRTKSIENVVIRNLLYVGEQLVNHARNLPSPSAADFDGHIPPHQPNYIDWTANLRSSIGYVLVVDGQVVKTSSFEPVSGGDEGAESGRNFVTKLAEGIQSGIALIVVAGMHYAKYVTARGYDVIDSAELLAQKLIPQMLKQLKIEE